MTCVTDSFRDSVKVPSSTIGVNQQCLLSSTVSDSRYMEDLLNKAFMHTDLAATNILGSGSNCTIYYCYHDLV